MWATHWRSPSAPARRWSPTSRSRNWMVPRGVKNVHPSTLRGGFNYPGEGQADLALHARRFRTAPTAESLRFPALHRRQEDYMPATPGFSATCADRRRRDRPCHPPIGDNFTMGPDDALRASTLIGPKRVVPIHYNTFDVIKQIRLLGRAVEKKPRPRSW